jgi:hypothetical protein
VGLVASKRADSQSLGVTRTRNYPMCKNEWAGRLDSGKGTGDDDDYALMAARRGWTPMMFITRVRL